MIPDPVADMRYAFSALHDAGINAGKADGVKAGLWVGLLLAVAGYMAWTLLEARAQSGGQ